MLQAINESQSNVLDAYSGALKQSHKKFDKMKSMEKKRLEGMVHDSACAFPFRSLTRPVSLCGVSKIWLKTMHVPFLSGHDYCLSSAVSLCAADAVRFHRESGRLYRESVAHTRGLRVFVFTPVMRFDSQQVARIRRAHLDMRFFVPAPMWSACAPPRRHSLTPLRSTTHLPAGKKKYADLQRSLADFLGEKQGEADLADGVANMKRLLQLLIEKSNNQTHQISALQMRLESQKQMNVRPLRLSILRWFDFGARTVPWVFELRSLG